MLPPRRRLRPHALVPALVVSLSACDEPAPPPSDASPVVDAPPAIDRVDTPDREVTPDRTSTPDDLGAPDRVVVTDTPAPLDVLDAPAADRPAPTDVMVATDASPARPRSVLIVIADDFGVDSAGFYADRDGDGNPDDGRTYAPMPTVADLCRRGVMFRQAWSAATCSPTRAQLLTGRFPFRTGVVQPVAGPDGAIRPNERTLPRVLDLNPALDFAHANIGKWHLGNSSALGGTMAPNRMGWSHYSGNLSAQIASFTAWDRVTDGLTERVTEYATTVTVNDATAWLDRQRPGRPWLLWVAFNAPHSPHHLPPASLVTTALPGTPMDIMRRPAMYFRASLEALDREIGRLLRHPRVASDQPLVVFFGDNGTSGEVVEAPYDRTRAKWTPYQNGLHVPMCVAGPGVAGARASDALINVVDLYPTALDAMGAARATWEAPGQPIDGVSYWPFLRDATVAAPRTTNFAEAPAGSGATPMSLGRAARDDRYKLLRFNDGREELYDLTSDPRELTNLRGMVDGDAALRARYMALVAVFDRHRL